jgi:hypothetical protein
MQSTGQTSTQELSLVPMHGSLITYAIFAPGVAAFDFFTRRMGKLSAHLLFLVSLCKTPAQDGSAEAA